MSSGFILTRTLGKTSGGGGGPQFGTKIANIVITPSQTKTIDSIPFTSYAAAKWLVSVFDDATASTYQSYEVHGHYTPSKPIPTHNISSILGDKIRNSVAVVVSGSNLVLQVTNNESYNIAVAAARYDTIA